MRDLKFGIEIEFYGVNYNKVVRDLTDKGINIEYLGYTHRVTSGWKLVTDSSVTNTGTGLSRGLEIVSPILYGDEGLDELQTVCNTLNSIGAKVNRTCGLHVHFDIADYSTIHVKNLLNYYYKYQTTIDGLLPRSRRGTNNSYCHSIRPSQMESINKDSCDTIQRIAWELSTRYLTVNLQSYLKYGTVEFRQHNGSTSYEKIEAWVIMLFQMLGHCKEFYVEQGKTRKSNKTIHNVLNDLKLNDTYTGEYLLNRFNYFKEVV